MEMNVRFAPETTDYLEELVTVLYQNGYFSWLDASKKYVAGLVEDIKHRLPLRPRRPAPPYFNRYGRGMYYASFPKNKHTTWYAFFRMYQKDGELYYQVRYITNNHVAAQHLL